MLTRLRAGFLTTLVAAGLFGPLSAQQTPTLAPGTRVRVGGVVGTLESIDSASIILRRADGRVANLPLARSTRVDVSTGRGICSPGHRGTCVLVGFLGGTALGALVAANKIRKDHWSDNLGDLAYLGMYVPGGAAVGMIVGVLVGGEHWKRAALPVHLSVAPGVPSASQPWRAVRVGARLTF